MQYSRVPGGAQGPTTSGTEGFFYSFLIKAVKAWNRHSTLNTLVSFYTSGLHASLLMLKARLRDGELGEGFEWSYETHVPSLFLSPMLTHHYEILAGVMASQLCLKQ